MLYIQDATGCRGEVQFINCKPDILPPDQWIGQCIVLGPLDVKVGHPSYTRNGKSFESWTRGKMYLMHMLMRLRHSDISVCVCVCVYVCVSRYLAEDVPLPVQPRPEPQFVSCTELQCCDVGTILSVFGILHSLEETPTDDGHRWKGALLHLAHLR